MLAAEPVALGPWGSTVAHAASQAASRRRLITRRPAHARHNSTTPSAVVATAAASVSLASTAGQLGGEPVGEPAASTHSRTARPAAISPLTGICPARARPSGAAHRA